MRDHAGAARSFNYTEAAAAALQGSLLALNACVECCDRHAGSGKLVSVNGIALAGAGIALRPTASTGRTLCQRSQGAGCGRR